MEKQKEIQKECKHHGLTKYLLQGKIRPRYYCAQCQIDSIDRRRRKIKLDAINYKGGKCCNCGYDKSTWALQFHHIDPLQKDFTIAASSSSVKWETVKSELDKCILLCANCHFEFHENLHNEKLN